MLSRGSAPAVGSSTIASIFTGSGASSVSMRSIFSENWVRLSTCTVAMTSGSRSPSTFSGVGRFTIAVWRRTISPPPVVCKRVTYW